MAETYARPLPAPDEETQPFWDACRAHELRAQRCTTCGRFRWPPSPLCPACHSWDFDWALLPGTGSVASFVVVHYSALPAFQDALPYVIAEIVIDGTEDHVEILSNVVDCPWESVQVGMPVRVVFEDVTPEVTLPKFHPAD